MATYHVYMEVPVSASVTVEAESPEAAIAAAYDSDDMPGSLCTLGGTPVDEAGDWTAVTVEADDSSLVWRESPEPAPREINTPEVRQAIAAALIDALKDREDDPDRRDFMAGLLTGCVFAVLDRASAMTVCASG